MIIDTFMALLDPIQRSLLLVCALYIVNLQYMMYHLVGVCYNHVNYNMNNFIICYHCLESGCVWTLNLLGIRAERR